MSTRHIAPYGSWSSPISAALVAAQATRLGHLAVAGGTAFWSEGRPSEGGRNAVVRGDAKGSTEDLLSPPWNARSRAHEYGGAAFAVLDTGTEGSDLVFVHFEDQRLYRQRPAGAPEALTAAGAGRFADPVYDRSRDRLFVVHESEDANPAAVANTLVAVDLGDGRLRPLAEGHDFFASPALSPDGERLAWLAWNHPHMPWDSSELWHARILADGALGEARRVAGGPGESVFQPQWSPDGVLHFVSDRTGWWNLYRFPHRTAEGEARPLHLAEAEFGMPQWLFGMSTYAFASAERMICSFTRDGTWQMAALELPDGGLRPIPLPYTHLEQVRCAASHAYFLAASPHSPPAVVALDLDEGTHHVVRSSASEEIPSGYLSLPRSIRFPSEDGATAYAFFYPPCNQDFEPPAGERPILLVKSHGGPTTAASTAFNLGVQYWTSRGFAVVDVDYGGSTGYGRAYRQRLQGLWGIVDVADCCAAASFLATEDEVDGERLAIRGGSAGGFTTLSALAFRDRFRAGASHYGIGDLEALARDTHKFESRYLDGLVGPYPERRDLYLERSPLRAAERLSCPVIFFQGLEDRVVPPHQAEAMVVALREKGVPVAYLPFAGEQHGFRRAESLIRALEAELYFYSRVFAVRLGEPEAHTIEPVVIHNLEAAGRPRR